MTEKKPEKGGQPLNEAKMRTSALRAEMCEVVRNFCLAHDAKIVDALMERYSVRRRVP